LYHKIPFVFRFDVKRNKIVYAVIAVLIVAICVLTTLFYDSAYVVRFQTAPGYESLSVNSYDYRYLIALIAAAVILILIACWMLLSALLEKRAFAKATKLANMIFLTQRHKEELAWQEWKMKNRSF